jgi:hypothetical protein
MVARCRRVSDLRKSVQPRSLFGGHVLSPAAAEHRLRAASVNFWLFRLHRMSKTAPTGRWFHFF